MIRIKDITKTLFLILPALWLMTSCSVEKKLGKEYREARPDSIALLLMPDYVFKYNLKSYEFPGIDSLPEWQQDSILITNSLFLQQLDDSVILEEFRQHFTSRLEKYQFRVVQEDALDTLLASPQSGLLVNVAQITLEEYVYPYSFDYQQEYDTYTVEGIDLNAVNVNVWIELGRFNSEQKNKVLFTSTSVADNLNGYFRQYLFSGNLDFEYTIDTMTLSQVVEAIGETGTGSATYLYDYLLNHYIWKHVPESYPYDLRPLRWNPEKALFEYIDPEDQFIEVEEK